MWDDTAKSDSDWRVWFFKTYWQIPLYAWNHIHDLKLSKKNLRGVIHTTEFRSPCLPSSVKWSYNTVYMHPSLYSSLNAYYMPLYSNMYVSYIRTTVFSWPCIQSSLICSSIPYSLSPSPIPSCLDTPVSYLYTRTTMLTVVTPVSYTRTTMFTVVLDNLHRDSTKL